MLLKKRANNQTRGFTLVEIVLAIVLLGIIAGGMSSLIIQGVKAFFAERDSINADWQGQVAIERMTRDLRTIRSAVDISIAAPNQISFTDFYGNSINYQVSGSHLVRNAQVLADGISSLLFSYYDAAGAPTAQIDAINYIGIKIHVVYGNTNFDLETAVYPWGLT